MTTSTDAGPVPVGKAGEFAELSGIVKSAGLLVRRRGAYGAKFALNAALLGGCVTAFVLLGPSWWQLAVAAVLAVVSTQLSYIGPDAGHRQIFRGRRANDVVGYVHGGLVGLSFGGWVDKHNQHHARPNHDDDPDIDIPVLAFSREQVAAKRGFSRWVVRHQAVMFVPLLLLEGFSLHVVAAQAVLRRQVPRVWLEGFLLVAHVVGYLAVVFWLLGPLQAVVFVAVHQGLWGLSMGLAFAPNHKGMPVIEAGRHLDHVRKQVLTSRNVRGGRVVDYLLGGLNYQIEHHLFPKMPRPNLRHAQPLVRAFCARHGLPYHQTGALESYAQVLRHLHEVSAPLRTAPVLR